MSLTGESRNPDPAGRVGQAVIRPLPDPSKVPVMLLRLRFPGEEKPTTIALEGSRISIGRSAGNAIRINDHTVSQHHAELVKAGESYQLRDLRSTNGVFVDGKPVTGWDLRQSCRVAFGTFECDFLLSTSPEETATAETVPSHAEVTSVRAENTALKAAVTRMEEELSALRKKLTEQGEHRTVPRSEYEGILARCATLKQQSEGSERALGRLESDLALGERARSSLTSDLAALRRELASRPQASELDDLGADKARLAAEVETATAELEKLRAAAAAGAGTLASLQNEHRSLAEAHTALQRDRNQEKTVHQNLRRDLDRVEAARVDLERRMTASGRELEVLREELTGRPAMSEIDGFKKEHAELCHQLETATAELESLSALRDEYPRLQEAHQRLAREFSDQETANQTLLSRLEQTEIARSDFERRLGDTQGALADLQQQYSALVKKASRLISPESVATLEGEIHALREHQNELETELAHQKKRFQDVLRECVDLEEKLRMAHIGGGAAEAVPGIADLGSLERPDEMEDEQLSEPAEDPRQVEDLLGELGFVIRPLGSGPRPPADRPAPEPSVPDQRAKGD